MIEEDLGLMHESFGHFKPTRGYGETAARLFTNGNGLIVPAEDLSLIIKYDHKMRLLLQGIEYAEHKGRLLLKTEHTSTDDVHQLREYEKDIDELKRLVFDGETLAFTLEKVLDVWGYWKKAGSMRWWKRLKTS